MTRGQLPQRADSLGLNGGGAAAAVPPQHFGTAYKILAIREARVTPHNFPSESNP